MNSLDAALRRPYPKTVVAVPAKNEADRIGPCLTALNHQIYPPDAVVLLLNNCTDETDFVARALSPELRYTLHIIPITLPPDRANAGQARRMAMALAAREAGRDGILLTTDADTVVPSDWIGRNLNWLLRGADLVCGKAAVDPVEAALIPARLNADHDRERHLIQVLDDLACQIDPDPYDPPRRHAEASGASLAVWVAVFDKVGGIPPTSCGEDRAFVDALRRIDARIRHDPAIEVVVSGRVLGRAEGGMAATLQRRLVRQDELADDQIEPAESVIRRVALRGRTRSAWASRRPDRFLAEDLAIEPALLGKLLSRPFFGAAWAEIESRSPRLARTRVRFTDLPAEIEAANSLLSRLQAPETMAAE
ncbi:glycosyltransferase [Rhodopila sp.]|uniref:glycosyltransferase n=1 Tax=Rhodopila sp. TaxID=2480087 RepID=UPI003D122D1E